MSLSPSDIAQLNSLLLECCRHSDWPSVRALIKAGASPDSLDDRGFQAPPLVQAAENGNIEMIRWLVDAKASPDLQSLRKTTALMRGAQLGRADVVDVLLELGANPRLQDQDKRTAAMMARDAGYPALAEKLREAEINAAATTAEKKQIRVLHLTEDLQQSFRQHDTARTALLLEEGADPNGRTLSGQAILQLLMTWKDREAEMRLLLNAGAKTNDVDSTGYLPLTSAFNMNAPHYCKILLEYGADPRAQDGKGNSAVMQMAEKGAPELVSFMAEQGISLHVVDNQGHTPLIKALIHRQFKTAKALALSGVALDCADTNGLTAFDHARQQGAFDVYSIMRARVTPRADMPAAHTQKSPSQVSRAAKLL